MHRLGLLLATLTLAVACGSTVTTTGGDDDGGGGTGVGVGGNTTQSFVGAPGVNIGEVAIYQGVKRVLAMGDVQQPSIVPLIAGRRALLRVFYIADASIAGTLVKGRLQIEGHAPIEADATLATASSEANLSSTINFELDPSMMGASFNYSVSILTQGTTDNPNAHHPAPGTLESHVVEGAPNTFRVVLVPFQYNADGSGRLPDTSPEAVELYKNRLLQLYPVSDVEVSVRAPVPWNSTISPFGQGWQSVMEQTYVLRLQDGVSPDVYYYSIFNPAPTLGQFCAQGCLLGVTGLNNQPPDVGEPELRWAVGLGYPQMTFDTCAHELGHSHGRGHVDCGPGVDPQSIDPGYPHAPSTIGTWGWDIVGGQLIDPAEHSDVMSYCDPTWISDHNYRLFFDRAANVNLAKYQGPPVTYDVLMWDGAEARWSKPLTVERPFLSAGTPVTFENDAGQTEQVEGHFVPYDHLPGGMWFVPRVDDEMTRATLTFEGVERAFTR